MPTATDAIRYQPDNAEDRAFILEMIRKTKRECKDMPGMPIGFVPMFLSLPLLGMIADGTLVKVEITKPRKSDPTKTQTYAYVKGA